MQLLACSRQVDYRGFVQHSEMSTISLTKPKKLEKECSFNYDYGEKVQLNQERSAVLPRWKYNLNNDGSYSSPYFSLCFLRAKDSISDQASTPANLSPHRSPVLHEKSN